MILIIPRPAAQIQAMNCPTCPPQPPAWMPFAPCVCEPGVTS